MFDFIGSSEIIIILVLFVVLFNARDMVKVAGFFGRAYRQLRRHYFRLRAEILYEPPSEEEQKAIQEMEEFYKKHGGNGEHPNEHPPESIKKKGPQIENGTVPKQLSNEKKEPPKESEQD